MAVIYGYQDVVFAISRYHLHPGAETAIYTPSSSPPNFANPWSNTLNGHPGVQAKSTENPTGQGDITLVYDFGTSDPSQILKMNAVGLVNLTWIGANKLDDEDLEVTIRTAASPTQAGSIVFSPSANQRRLRMESATSRTWLLQLDEVEHTQPSVPFLRSVRVIFDSYPTSTKLRWIGVGEVFFGTLYHPPCPTYPVTIKQRPGMLLRSSDAGWSWERRTREATTEITLRWFGISIEERIELQQFAANAGDPWYADHIGQNPAPRPGLADFGSPMLLSMHEDPYGTDPGVVRNAIYCVVDPRSVVFQQDVSGLWNVQMTFLEVS
ncbi:MAG: hypothetical protein ACE5FA_02160 [Dehalococcoidia bacterium]